MHTETSLQFRIEFKCVECIHYRPAHLIRRTLARQLFLYLSIVAEKKTDNRPVMFIILHTVNQNRLRIPDVFDWPTGLLPLLTWSIPTATDPEWCCITNKKLKIQSAIATPLTICCAHNTNHTDTYRDLRTFVDETTRNCLSRPTAISSIHCISAWWALSATPDRSDESDHMKHTDYTIASTDIIDWIKTIRALAWRYKICKLSPMQKRYMN